MTQDLLPLNVPASRALVVKLQHLPRVTKDEVRQLLNATPNPKHRILIRLLWATGARVSEITGDNRALATMPGLRVHDLFRRSGQYFVRMRRLKRRKEMVDEVELPFDLGLGIEDYVGIMRLGGQDRIVGMDRRGAWKAIKEIGLRVLGRPINPRMFRHGFAYEMHGLGASPYLLASMMGHANLSSSLKYFHADEAEVRRFREAQAI